MKRICICGGGNLGHVIAGFLAAQEQLEINLLTRNPQRWSQHLHIHTPDGNTLTGQLNIVSSEPSQVVATADMVLLCLPGFSLATVLRQIAGHLQPEAWVGSVVSNTGFFFEAMQLLPSATPLFGFQRVPFIARTEKYGSEAYILGYKQKLNLAVEQCEHPEIIRKVTEQIFKTPVYLLNNYYEASLSNSNPLLHPARLYDLWHDWNAQTYETPPAFYGDWTENASRLYIAMDNELHNLLKILPVAPNCIPTVLDYYESADPYSLTKKMQSIPAFQGIPAPMTETANGWIPDFNSRYFTEDFPYGLGLIRQLARKKELKTPVIDKIYDWGMTVIANHQSGT